MGNDAQNEKAAQGTQEKSKAGYSKKWNIIKPTTKQDAQLLMSFEEHFCTSKIQMHKNSANKSGYCNLNHPKLAELFIPESKQRKVHFCSLTYSCTSTLACATMSS